MKLTDYLAEFEGAEPEDALEMLLEFSDKLPQASAGRASLGVSAGCRVQECQTPVILWVDVQDGVVRLEAEVPEQSPTVRGFVALLVNGLTGVSPQDVACLPDNLLPQLGLQKTLGMTRERGFAGILAQIKRRVAQHAG